MAFFSDGEDRRKLTILYVLKRSGIPLSREQLVFALSALQLDADNYFDISSRMLELEQNGYIASIPTYKFQLAVLTAKGEDTIGMFANDLPRSVREALDNFIEVHRSEFHRENTSRVISEPLPDGGIDMTFALVEQGDPIFEVRFRLPSDDYAQLAAQNWDGIAQELYLSTVMKLTQKRDK